MELWPRTRRRLASTKYFRSQNMDYSSRRSKNQLRRSQYHSVENWSLRVPDVSLRIHRFSWSWVRNLTYANISKENVRERQGDTAVPLLCDSVPRDWTAPSAGQSPPHVPSIRCSSDSVLLCFVFFSSRGSAEEHARSGTHNGNCEDYCWGRDDCVDILFPQVPVIFIVKIISLVQRNFPEVE